MGTGQGEGGTQDTKFKTPSCKHRRGVDVKDAFHLPCYWFVFFFFSLWPRHTACGILVPRPGIKPVTPAVDMWSPNHWTAREFHPVTVKCLRKSHCVFLYSHTHNTSDSIYL